MRTLDECNEFCEVMIVVATFNVFVRTNICGSSFRVRRRQARALPNSTGKSKSAAKGIGSAGDIFAIEMKDLHPALPLIEAAGFQA